MIVLSDALYDARKHAMKRMVKQAEDVKADGIVGVRLSVGYLEWNKDLAFFAAIGTAVKDPVMDWRVKGKPFTNLMRAQQFWRLWQSGYQPCGIAVGACSYSDCGESSVLHRAYNQEVASYTASFYDAHGMAMEGFSKGVRQLNGTGAVGMEVAYKFEDVEKELEVSEGVSMTYLHLITHFVIIGTAIKRREAAASMLPQRTLRILDLSRLPEKR
jgi:uncharacterized protein YbjQ (UPF0145 family)